MLFPKRWSGVRPAADYSAIWVPHIDSASLRPVGVELWPLNERLTVLMEACLLGDLGFDHAATSEAIRRASGSYRALKLNGL